MKAIDDEPPVGAAVPQTPTWYRGPQNSSKHRIGVAVDLRQMRGREGARLTQKDMAVALSRELGRNIPESSVARWENGHKLAGADVYRAYMQLTAAAHPTDVDERLLWRQMESRVARLERASGLPTLDLPRDDLLTLAEAARLIKVSRQTIHNWIKAGKVRFSTQGRRLLVSRADILACQDEMVR